MAGPVGLPVIDTMIGFPHEGSAQYDFKQAACPVIISGLDQLKNAGKEQMIDLLEGRISVAESSMMNLLLLFNKYPHVTNTQKTSASGIPIIRHGFIDRCRVRRPGRTLRAKPCEMVQPGLPGPP